MKKKVITTIIVLIVIGAISALVYAGITMYLEEKELNKHLITLDYTTLKEKIDNQDSFILVITASDCPHCTQYKPTLKRVLYEYDLYAYEIQNDKLTADEKAFLNSIASISGTPSTIFIENGSEKNTMNRIVGNANSEQIKTRLKALGYIS